MTPNLRRVILTSIIPQNPDNRRSVAHRNCPGKSGHRLHLTGYTNCPKGKQYPLLPSTSVWLASWPPLQPSWWWPSSTQSSSWERRSKRKRFQPRMFSIWAVSWMGWQSCFGRGRGAPRQWSSPSSSSAYSASSPGGQGLTHAFSSSRSLVVYSRCTLTIKLREIQWQNPFLINLHI